MTSCILSRTFMCRQLRSRYGNRLKTRKPKITQAFHHHIAPAW